MAECIGHGPPGFWPGNEEWAMMCLECHRKLFDGYVFHVQIGCGPFNGAIEYKLVHGVLALRILKPLSKTHTAKGGERKENG